MSVDSALIVGAGVAGTTLAGELQRDGVRVDLVEIESEPPFRGIGIALLPPALRSMHALGVADQCVDRGVAQYQFTTCTADGTPVNRSPMHGLLGEGYPPALGISRSVLGEILRERAASAGVTMRFGTTVTALTSRPDGVEVEFSDGSSGSYAVVVGADGLRSAIRAMMFEEEPPAAYLGQWVWRVLVGARPEEVDGQMLFLGRETRAGFNPILPDDMYIYLVHDSDDPELRLSREESHAQMMEMLGEYGGLMGEMSGLLTADSPAHHGPLYTSFIAGDWYRGRTILIGDAAHTTPPHLASGAGIAIEDAIVLARCLRECADVGAAFAQFMDQRYERCRMVIENSRTLSRWDREPDVPGLQVAQLVGQTFEALERPI